MLDLLEKINVQHILVIVFVGIAMIVAVIKMQNDIALAFGSGLVGYLSGLAVSNSQYNSHMTLDKEGEENNE